MSARLALQASVIAARRGGLSPKLAPPGTRSLAATRWLLLAPNTGYPRAGDPDETRMTISDKRKQSLYFPEQMLKEIQDEGARQDRSLSWIVQRAWQIARKDVMKLPGHLGPEDDETDNRTE